MTDLIPIRNELSEYGINDVKVSAQVTKGTNGQLQLHLRSMPGLSFSSHPLISLRDLTLNVSKPKEGECVVVKEFPYVTDLGSSGVLEVVISSLDAEVPTIELREKVIKEA